MEQSKKFPRFYILVGEENNWKITLEKNVWGFKVKSKGLWTNLQINEFLAFYVTKPTQKIIGFGQVTKKFRDYELLWPMEISSGNAIWTYRINFNPFFVIKNWSDGIVVPKNIALMSSRTVIDKTLFFDFIKNAEKKWGTKLVKDIKKKYKELSETNNSINEKK